MQNNELPDWLKEPNVNNHSQTCQNSRLISINLRIISFFIKHFQNEAIVTDNKQSAWLKLISILVTLILILCSTNIKFLWIVIIIILFKVCQLPSQQVSKLSSHFFKMFLCSVIFVMPNFVIGNVQTTFFFILRLMAIVLDVAYFLQINSWQQVIVGLRQLHCPNLIILILDISLKYIHTLAIFLRESLWSVQLRMVGKTLNNRNIIGKVFGQLYLNSKKYTNEVFNAMLLRGYKINPKQKNSIKINKSDYSLVIINLIIIVFFVNTSM